MLLTDLWTISISLKTILCETGSQCSSFKIGVIWHDFLDKVTTRAAVFCMCWRRDIWFCGRPYKRLLDQTSLMCLIMNNFVIFLDANTITVRNLYKCVKILNWVSFIMCLCVILRSSTLQVRFRCFNDHHHVYVLTQFYCRVSMITPSYVTNYVAIYRCICYWQWFMALLSIGNCCMSLSAVSMVIITIMAKGKAVGSIYVRGPILLLIFC